MKRTAILIGLALSGLSSGSAMSAPRQSAQSISFTVYHCPLAIGGTEILILRGDTLAEVNRRADIVLARLNEMLGDATLTGDDVQVKLSGKEQAIFVKEKLLLTVTLQDAKYNQTTVEKQAMAWRERLAEVLPTLKATEIPPAKR